MLKGYTFYGRPDFQKGNLVAMRIIRVKPASEVFNLRTLQTILQEEHNLWSKCITPPVYDQPDFRLDGEFTWIVRCHPYRRRKYFTKDLHYYRIWDN